MQLWPDQPDDAHVEQWARAGNPSQRATGRIDHVLERARETREMPRILEAAPLEFHGAERQPVLTSDDQFQAQVPPALQEHHQPEAKGDLDEGRGDRERRRERRGAVQEDAGDELNGGDGQHLLDRGLRPPEETDKRMGDAEQRLGRRTVPRRPAEQVPLRGTRAERRVGM